ncbi:MAG: cytochrome c [Gemmataceae bacterium]|nr:cytochrome c [Gemmataceae bacterium]
MHSEPLRPVLSAAFTLLVLAAWPAAAAAQEAAAFFKQNCASCHTIGGGRLTGPDLKDVTQRKQDREWLLSFIVNPKAVLDSGDSYAAQLKRQYGGVEMPVVFGMTRARAESLLSLIEAESKLDRSQFAGVVVSDRELTPVDVERGRDFFMGHTRFADGGPACISCHSANGVGLLGGGRLGPDLTRVYERLNGRKQLVAWLSAPATATMQPVYKAHPLRPEEILPLVAFLEQTARHGREDSGVSPLNFFLVGLGGTTLALIGFDAIWRRRFRAVRRPLVHSKNGKGEA